MKKAELNDIKVGGKLKIFYNKGNINNNKIEIRGIVDDEIIVYKTWLKRKGYWDYRITDKYFMSLLIKAGNLFLR
jgi:hypothetical protein